MKKINTYNEFLNENKSEILVQIGDYVLTQHDLETKHKSQIESYYGDFTEDTINNALWTLYDIQQLYDKGGIIYRIIFLNEGEELNEDNLGHHWLPDKGDTDNIVDIWRWRDDMKGTPYVITANTPPKNVTIADDYFANLEEHEVLVKDPKKLELISFEKYK